MNAVIQAARRLTERPAGHRIISLYLNLDPERFATPPARAAQIRSLVDEAAKELEATDGLDHDERVGLREDLERVRDYLLSDAPPFQGSRALALFCSGRGRLFETISLTQSVASRVVLEDTAYVEPLLCAAGSREWLVVLVNRREAHVFSGPADRLRQRQDIEDEVHGRHEQGGRSQPRHERSFEKDVDEHLKLVAEVIERQLRGDGFDRLALGGPTEIVPRLEGLLGEEVRARLSDRRVEVDLSSARASDVVEALRELAEHDEERSERAALDRMAAGIGSGGRGAGGAVDTLQALGERRVEILLLTPEFDGAGYRCPSCGLLVLEPGACPADGTAVKKLEHLREAVVELALAQDAEVMVVRHHADLGRHRGIGAVLRF